MEALMGIVVHAPSWIFVSSSLMLLTQNMVKKNDLITVHMGISHDLRMGFMMSKIL